MLTIIIATYLVLSLLVGIVIFSACIVASRADKVIEAQGTKRPIIRRSPVTANRLPAKPAGRTLQRVSSFFYRSSSLN